MLANQNHPKKRRLAMENKSSKLDNGKDYCLSVEKAKELASFIYKTNYKLAFLGGDLLDSEEEALVLIEHDDYDSQEPLSVCFDTKQLNYWDSAEVHFKDGLWHADDIQMGGLSCSSESIEALLIEFRSLYDADDDYCPVELIIS